jgi:hypothetical protein
METLRTMKTLAPVTDRLPVAEPILRSQRCGPAPPENPCHARMQPDDDRPASLPAPTRSPATSEGRVIFVFGTPPGVDALENILSDEDFWTLVSSLEHIAADRPRIAQ